MAGKTKPTPSQDKVAELREQQRARLAEQLKRDAELLAPHGEKVSDLITALNTDRILCKAAPVRQTVGRLIDQLLTVQDALAELSELTADQLKP
jgi:hypothetical protein